MPTRTSRTTRLRASPVSRRSTTVSGDLTIQGNGVLTNVGGFKALATVGGYAYIYNNADLQTLGFVALTTVGSYLNIGCTTRSSTNLSSLNGFDERRHDDERLSAAFLYNKWAHLDSPVSSSGAGTGALTTSMVT